MKQYLEYIFGDKLSFKNITYPNNTPIYIKNSYDIKEYTVFNYSFILVTMVSDEEFVRSLKHLDIISKLFNKTCVLGLNHLSSYQRKTLLKKGIPFIYRDSQMFLPFLGIMFEESFSIKKENKNKLSNNAQFVFLYLYNYFKDSDDSIKMIDITKSLNITKSKCTRAIAEIENFDLFQIQEKGREKYVLKPNNLKDCINKALKLLDTPVKKSLYVKELPKGLEYRLCGLLALEEKTMLAYKEKDEGYAIDEKELSKVNNYISKEEYLNEGGYCIKVYKYNPIILSKDTCVDNISLILEIGDSKDERIIDSLYQLRQKTS